MEIVIFRHGQTDWNLEGRLQGNTDTDLNETGLRQAIELAQRLRHFKFDTIVSSDLSRAFKTAEIVAKEQSIPIMLDQRLRELGLGDAEGKTKTELEELYGVKDFASYNFPGRETAASVANRVNALIDELYAKKYQSIALSSHGGVVWNWLSSVVKHEQVGHVGNTDAFHLHLRDQQFFYLGKISNSKN